MHEPATGKRRGRPRRWRSSILVRLLAAFVVVSFLPNADLAALSLQEATADPETHPVGAESTESTESTESNAHGTLFSIPIEFVELGVAGTSLLLRTSAPQSW